jgi:hypothetical protein
MKKNMNKMFPAGKYYIGDLCYISNDHGGPIDWNEFCKIEEDGSKVTLKSGLTIWWSSTAYGDGCFPSNVGMNFGVDAGLIGVCPVQSFPKDFVDFNPEYIYDMDKDFDAYYENGTFHIGHIEIYTDENPDEYIEDEEGYTEDDWNA